MTIFFSSHCWLWTLIVCSHKSRKLQVFGRASWLISETAARCTFTYVCMSCCARCLVVLITLSRGWELRLTTLRRSLPKSNNCFARTGLDNQKVFFTLSSSKSRYSAYAELAIKVETLACVHLTPSSQLQLQNLQSIRNILISEPAKHQIPHNHSIDMKL